MRRLAPSLAPLLLLTCCLTLHAQQPSPGQRALAEFMSWKDLPDNAQLPWDQALERYRTKLTQGGLTAEAAEKQIRLITAYDDATLYNRVYSTQSRTSAFRGGWAPLRHRNGSAGRGSLLASDSGDLDTSPQELIW